MFTITDLTTVKDSKIKLSFLISKEDLSIKDAVEIFRTFSKYKSNSTSHRDKKPNIEEKDGNILITYYTSGKDLQKEHNEHIEYTKSCFSWFSRDFEFIDSKLNYNVEDTIYQKLIHELVNFNRELPFEESNSLEWFKENISESILPIDILVNGKRAYMYRHIEKDTFSSISVEPYGLDSYRFNSVIPEGCDTEVPVDTIKKVYINLIDKLNITGYPITGFDNRFLYIMFEDTPNYFSKIFRDNQMYDKAKIFYGEGSSKKYVDFWEKYLKQDWAMKQIDNPLLKKREKELQLSIYVIEVEVLKSDGYECYKTDIEHTFCSNEPLDQNILMSLYENEYDYEVREFLSIKCQEVKECYNLDKSTFIEVSDGKYITRPANHRFKQLITT